MGGAAKTEASKGISNPVEGTIRAKSTLYRFGRDLGHATFGGWWHGEEQDGQIKKLAALSGMCYPCAARMLSAILHSYNEMTHLVKVTTVADLACYFGPSRQQTEMSDYHGSSGVAEAAYEVRSPLIGPYNQFYIPGIGSQKIRVQALDAERVVSVFAAEDSHLFGTYGAPVGRLAC